MSIKKQLIEPLLINDKDIIYIRWNQTILKKIQQDFHESYMKWDKAVLKNLQHDLLVFLKKNCLYIKIIISKYIIQKWVELEDIKKKTDIDTKVSHFAKTVRPFGQIIIILCLISFVLINLVIVVKGYYESRKMFILSMENSSCINREITLIKQGYSIPYCKTEKGC